jgi:hypothetical protein
MMIQWKSGIWAFLLLCIAAMPGCGSQQPDKKTLMDLENKFIQQWEVDHFFKTVDFEIQEGHTMEDGRYYVEGYPVIKLENQLFREFLYDKHVTSRKFKRAIVKFEYLKDFHEGKIEHRDLMMKLDDKISYQKDYTKPRGTLSEGDQFKGEKRHYLMEKSKEGWKVVKIIRKDGW